MPQPLYVVDEEFVELCKYRWQDEGHGYLVRTSKGKGGVRKGKLLHREVWRLAYGTVPKELNHINGIKHDCRLCNLEPATRALNNLLRNYKQRDLPVGVYRRGNSFRASVGFKWLGTFRTVEEAAAARQLELDKRVQEERSKCKNKT